MSTRVMTCSSKRLHRIRLLHTLVWAVFAGAILAIPIAAHCGRVDVAGWLIALVGVEVLVLVANRMRCPLTAVAARYTTDRAANFDIYLPRWLARNNQRLFGTLFVAGVVDTLWCWFGGAAAG